MKKIIAPIPSGCGAYISHRFLESQIPGYHVVGYDPRWTLLPPLLPLLLRSKKADLIHTTPDHGIFFAKSDSPLVITFRNYVLDPFMKEYSSLFQRMHYKTDLRLFTKLALNRAASVTAVSEATAALVKSDIGFQGSIHVIPNGIDEAKFEPPTSRPDNKVVKVLFSGNPTRRKGAHWLPAIAEKVNKHVEIIVTGGLRAVKLNGAMRLRYIGKIPPEQMPELYQSADILLLPTVREGLCRAALEAMSTGLPVVTTSASSMPELIHHERGGYLCDLGDTEAFAQAINLLAEDRKRRIEMGEYNRARILEHFNARKMIEAYRDLFEKIR